MHLLDLQSVCSLAASLQRLPFNHTHRLPCTTHSSVSSVRFSTRIISARRPIRT